MDNTSISYGSEGYKYYVNLFPSLLRAVNYIHTLTFSAHSCERFYKKIKEITFFLEKSWVVAVINFKNLTPLFLVENRKKKGELIFYSFHNCEYVK